jgi:hypothetical protein
MGQDSALCGVSGNVRWEHDTTYLCLIQTFPCECFSVYVDAGACHDPLCVSIMMYHPSFPIITAVDEQDGG